MTTPESFPPPQEHNPVGPATPHSPPPYGYPPNAYPNAYPPSYLTQPAPVNALNIGLLATLFAVVVTIMGAFLPWVKLAFFSKTGIEGDGSITLAMAVIAGLLAVLGLVLGRGVTKAAGITTIVMGALVSLVGIIDLVDVANRVNEVNELSDEVGGSVGAGLILTVIGGLTLLGSGILTLVLARKRR